MGKSVPMACSLSEGEAKDRLAEMAGFGRTCLVESTLRRAEATLRFDLDEDETNRMHDLVEAESRCCAFLDLDLAQDEEGYYRLTVAGPSDAEEAVATFVEAFTAGREKAT